MIKMQLYPRLSGRHGQTPSVLIFTTLILTAVLFAPVTFAATSNHHCKAQSGHNNSADCVFDWGAWGLNIEPAAGGVSHSPGQIIKPLHSQFSLTTNSTAALAPAEIPPVVTPPPVNTAPPSPNTRPYKPGEPIATGTPRRQPSVTQLPVNTAPPSPNTKPYKPSEPIATGTPRR